MKEVEKRLDFIAQNTALLVDMLCPIYSFVRSIHQFESQRFINEEKVKSCNIGKLWQYGYRIYSQNEEDGIIAEIFKRIGTTTHAFIEFGAGEGHECNTAKLLVEGWHGLWMEGSENRINELLRIQDQFKGRLKVKKVFITAENINELLEDLPYGEIDLLSIDIDYNDYWVWKALTVVNPRVVIIEYNASFPPPISLVVPYEPKVTWQVGTNYSGASLEAMTRLARIKGYSLVGCNFTGINAFYVRNDLINDDVFLTPFTAERHYEPLRLDVNRDIVKPTIHLGLEGHASKVGPYIEVK